MDPTTLMVLISIVVLITWVLIYGMLDAKNNQIFEQDTKIREQESQIKFMKELLFYSISSIQEEYIKSYVEDEKIKMQLKKMLSQNDLDLFDKSEIEKITQILS